MAQTNVVNTKWIQWIVASYVFVLAIGLIMLRVAAGPSGGFALHFNPYALISLAAVAANVVIVFSILERSEEFRGNEATWYFLYLGAIIVFSVAELLQRSSASPVGALFWAQLGGIGPAFEPVGIFLFTLLYVSRRPRNVSFIPLVLLGAATLFFFHGNGSIVFQTNNSAITYFPWGYNNQIGNGFGLNALWALGLPIISIGMLFRFRRRSQDQVLKAQARLFNLAFLALVIGALLFDIVGPGLGWSVPPLHAVFSVITAGVLLYGLRHYKVFDVTPASLADDILATMSESVVVTDRDLKIGLMNNTAEQLFGANKTDGDKSFLKLFDSAEAERIRQAVAAMSHASSPTFVGNYTIRRGNQPVYVSISASNITEEQGTPGYVFVVADVTELQKEKQSVERKVEERTRELRQAQQRIAETDAIKTEFVILTSHNLRTPLSIINGNVELLGQTKLDGDQKHMLQALQSGSIRLGSLVEDLLTISRLEAGDKLKLDHLTLKQILDPLAEEAAAMATASHNQFELKAPTKDIKISVNTSRFSTAILNLLNNAFKFTKEGTVTLAVETKGSKLVWSVSDTGIGIAAAEIPQLFTKFHRSSGEDGLTYNFTGEGIGLYLTKLIVEEHGGTINVSSELGKGSTFTITIPLKQ